MPVHRDLLCQVGTQIEIIKRADNGRERESRPRGGLNLKPNAAKSTADRLPEGYR